MFSTIVDDDVGVGGNDFQVEPSEVSTFPVVPGATFNTGLVPFPNKTLFNGNDVTPVPPLLTDSKPLILVASTPKL